MEIVNESLKNYIEKNILPIYEKNDSGHGIDHIEYVINRSLEFAKQFPNINYDMVYVISAFHDIAHHIDKDNHETLSAKWFYEDEKMKDFFDVEQRLVIKEAIEDHRALLKYEPRSDYGKIISSADRTTSVYTVLKRTEAYTLRHYPNLEMYQRIERAYKHMLKKYGSDGYAKNYCLDKAYEQFRKEVEIILKDKWEFVKMYFEVNGVVNLKEKAKIFAINAHRGQVRKGEVDKPMIMHPISVGGILEEYGYDEQVVAAGYLHDVVEDTKYTIQDIENEFGEEIASLVMTATEPDKSLPWEERKMHTIEKTKKLPLINKVIICADKIDNLEDLMIKFVKSEKRDFSAFKRGEEEQKWYYTNVYESLILGEDKDLPIFARLKDILDTVFYKKEDLYLKNTIFEDNVKYYEELKKLDAEKAELKKLKALCSRTKSFVIEFSGTPRTGKTTTINNLYDFFKKGGFSTKIIEEFTTSRYYKEVFNPKYKDADSTKRNVIIAEEVIKQLEDGMSERTDIILVDRSINDRQMWNYRRYVKKDMPEALYQELREKYSEVSRKLIDFLVITYAEPVTSLKRDYNSSLALEKRNFLNMDNLNEYNKSLKDLQELFKVSVENYLLLDTTNVSMNEVSVKIASEIMPAIRKAYIKSFKEKYDLP